MKTVSTIRAGNGSASRRNKAKTATIDRVAALAGVSPSTVSRILNGTAVVNEAKRKAVDQAIAELGFVPNPVARGLAGGKTFSIGVITQAIDSPFYGAALRGIEDELDHAGYCPLFVSGHWNAAAETRGIDVLRARRVDGIIVLTGRLPDQTLKTCAKSIPVVVTGRDLKAPGLFSLNFDNFNGGRIATQHLIDLGHRNIAFIAGDGDHPDANERMRGYRAALDGAGLRFDPKLVIAGAFHEVSGAMAVDQLMQSRRRFTAIFAANDQMAIGANLALQRRSLRVPADVSLVGFDDLPAAMYAVPPISTVRQPAYEIGRLAAVGMLQLIAGEAPRAQVPPPVLVARESARRLST